MMELVGIWLAAVLTLMVFSYLLSDNPLYAVVVVFHNLLLPRLLAFLADPLGYWHLLIPLILGIVLFSKARPATSWVGNISLAFLFGVGIALAIGGALVGSLLYQIKDTILPLSPKLEALDNFILVLGVVCTLSYFYFTAGGPGTTRVGGGLIRVGSLIGRAFIMLTFGALFASAVMSRISLLIGRLHFLLGNWLGLM
jgi:hypothetical protein